MKTAISNVIQEAREQLRALLGLELGSTVSVRKDSGAWRVQVEAVEKKSIPDSQDILATYDLTVDDEGNVVDFTRSGMRRRGEVVEPAGAEQEV